jgi:peroxiredoxin
MRGSFLTIALIAATALAGYLTLQNDRLVDRLQRATESGNLPGIGYVVPAYSTRTTAGTEIVLGESSDSTFQLLFYFTTTCEYCKESLAAWRGIFEEVRTWPYAPIRVVGISSDSALATEAYVAQNDLRFPVVSFESRKQRILYRTRIVPQIVLLDHQGFVRYSRYGVVPASAIDSVVSAVRAAIPVRATDSR